MNTQTITLINSIVVDLESRLGQSISEAIEDGYDFEWRMCNSTFAELTKQARDSSILSRPGPFETLQGLPVEIDARVEPGVLILRVCGEPLPSSIFDGMANVESTAPLLIAEARLARS